MRRYFAYGSNMDEKQMRERCPQSEAQGKAELSGHEFFINKRSFANIRLNSDKKVVGIIYNITENDEEKLDVCEGVQHGTNTKENSVILNAYYYVARETNEGRPEEGYLEKIIKAAQVYNFPKEYIVELKKWSK